jgi:hypothetical protein
MKIFCENRVLVFVVADDDQTQEQGSGPGSSARGVGTESGSVYLNQDSDTSCHFELLPLRP